MLSEVMLSVIVVWTIMLSVTRNPSMLPCYAQYHCPVFGYAECQFAECQLTYISINVESATQHTECQKDLVLAECHCNQHHNAECRS